ncbi:putative arabinosyltransferase ARAD1 [Dichanthelium oligosanthes]|uniref:Putative arabinosyltransferase ARAD1 n=1 Tax=Dichanthelium oligosanthes TaxID=888268 RepID=A0A1E5VBD5_9POAL|nr:putative arabinosyltransferase ARAD1 [Dichanthelium oligosanthes]
MAAAAATSSCRSPLAWLFALAAALFFASWYLLLDSAAGTPTAARAYLGGGGGRRPGPGHGRKCDPAVALLRVFMYDLPPEFHFGLLDWKPPGFGGGGVWPDVRGGGVPEYPGGLNLQHSIEYWLTLDLLASEQGAPTPCAAVRVPRAADADVVFVPFFASLSFNRHSRVVSPARGSEDRALQRRLIEFLAARPEWRRSGGRDHVVLAHHPNGMLDARYRLWPCVFVLCDFGRYPPSVANLDKDVIAPYRHVVANFANDTAGYDDRPTLLYFQGAIYRKDGGSIRQELYYLLKDEKDVHFSFGSVAGNGIAQAAQGMRASKFCLNIAGDTPSSNRLFDSIVSHCVPVIISDEIELPFEDVLDYSKFSVIVRGADAVKKGFLMNLIRGIRREEWTLMWNRLKEVEKHFEYQYPSQTDDAVQMIWKTIARKVPSIRLKINRLRRFSRFETNKTDESPPHSSSWLQNQTP